MVREMGIEIFGATARFMIRGELWDDDGDQPKVDLLVELFEGTLTRRLVGPPPQDRCTVPKASAGEVIIEISTTYFGLGAAIPTNALLTIGSGRLGHFP